MSYIVYKEEPVSKNTGVYGISANHLKAVTSKSLTK